jgi:CRISPR-associated protein Cas2
MSDANTAVPDYHSRRRQRFLVAYDIGNDRQRRRLARLLQSYGERMQKSVFLCDLDMPTLQRLKVDLERTAIGESDQLKLLPVREEAGRLPLFWLAA